MLIVLMGCPFSPLCWLLLFILGKDCCLLPLIYCCCYPSWPISMPMLFGEKATWYCCWL